MDSTLPTTPANIPVLNLFSLTNQNALVTGASRGIGSAVALALAQAGASLCLVVRPGNEAAELPIVQTIHASVPNAKIYVVHADLGDAESVKGVVPKALDAFKALEGNTGIDIMVNCAGIQRRAPAEVFPEADWDEIVGGL